MNDFAELTGSDLVDLLYDVKAELKVLQNRGYSLSEVERQRKGMLEKKRSRLNKEIKRVFFNLTLPGFEE